MTACATLDFCASRPLLPVQSASFQARPRCVRGVRVLSAAAAARPSPAAGGGDVDSAAGSSSRPPSARELARQQRAREKVQGFPYALARNGQWSPMDKFAAQTEATAAELLMAGMTRPAAFDLLKQTPSTQQNVASLQPQALAPKLASVRAFLRGEPR